MKKTILIGLLGISYLFSPSLFAYKILWTKESVSRGVEGHIERYINSQPSKPQWNIPEVQVSDIEGNKNIPVNEHAMHGIHIYNELNQVRRYKFYYELSSLGKAFQYWGELELKPIEHYDETAKSSLTIQESRKGTFNITAKTRVSGDGLKIAEKHAKLAIIN